MAKVGFVGLGNMGGPMARNLITAGHEVKVYDLVPELTAQLVKLGAESAESPRAAAEAVEFFVSMLPASQHVKSLYLDRSKDGTCLLDAITPETIVIDCSTISPEAAIEVAKEAAAQGLAMLDAPVSGGTAGAENASLTFIVGGEEKILEAARSLLEDMGRNIFHAGNHGAGQVAKICNNMLLAVSMTATAESLALGVANGLDPAVLSQIMQQSSGGNWALNVYNPYPGVMEGVPASKGYQGGFLVDLMLKDLGLAMETAELHGSATPMGSLAMNLYRLHRHAHDAGRLDFSSIQHLYSDLQ